MCLKKDQKVERELLLDTHILVSPVRQGTRVGEVVYRTQEEEIRIPLVTGQTVTSCVVSAGPVERLWERLQNLLPG